MPSCILAPPDACTPQRAHALPRLRFHMRVRRSPRRRCRAIHRESRSPWTRSPRGSRDRSPVAMRNASCSPVCARELPRHALRIRDTVVEPQRITVADLEVQGLGRVRIRELLDTLRRADDTVVAALRADVEVGGVSLGHEAALAARARDRTGGRRRWPELPGPRVPGACSAVAPVAARSPSRGDPSEGEATPYNA